MSERRRFNRRERTALYLAADGRCENCGRELEPGWHGDHVQPWSRGGDTDVINGQALCPDCNLEKGIRMTIDDPRFAWQRHAYDRYLARAARDFLVVATPGAGKTTLALRIAGELLRAGVITRIFVVCPSDHLKTQWRDKANEFGISLNADWRNSDGALAADYDGVTVTYQQVDRNPDLHRRHARTKTLVILDEVHHAGDERSWGTSVQEAFEPAVRRLSLSGTPFRSDDVEIAFVSYDDEGYAIADYTYTFVQAQLDHVCRPVYFPRMGGRAEWISRGKAFDHTFEEELSERRAKERLRTALDLRTPFVGRLLDDANRQLKELREDDPEAGGLVIAMDRDHAGGIAELMEIRLGIRPVLVTYNDPAASDKIKAFDRGTEPWIVAVKMVSEGVDIPRLRVLAYATNTATSTFFRQAVGRIVRWRSEGPEEQAAFCFIPDDPTLRKFAEEIKKQRVEALERKTGQLDEDLDRDGPNGSETSFQAINAEALFAGVEHDGDAVTADEYLRAEQEMRDVGGPLSVDAVTALARINRMRSQGSEQASSPAPPPNAENKDDRKKRLRDVQNAMVRQHCIVHGLEFKRINYELNNHPGVAVKHLRDATEEQLLIRLEAVKKMVAGDV